MEINKKLLGQAFSKEPVIIFIGQSGCGKETQSNATISAYKDICPGKEVYVAESGKLWRDGIPSMTTFSRVLLKEIQTAGKLQSWITTSALWASKFLYGYNGGLIIVDGSPRSIPETKALVDFYHGFAKKDIIVFLLDISDQEAEKRMISRNEAIVIAGGTARSDTDTREKRQAKIAYFHTDVIPALQHLSPMNGVTLYTIDGMMDPEDVTSMILSLLSNFHSR